MKHQYEEFLQSKILRAPSCGLDLVPQNIDGHLSDWQAEIVRRALKQGRMALWEDCGMGKTRQQLSWGQIVHEQTGDNVLIQAPLAVNQQTIREGEQIGIEVHSCRSQAEIQKGLNISNYEMLEHFDLDTFGAIIPDESSILKSLDGRTRNFLIEKSQRIPYRLPCTATPAPNDFMEIGNHAEFLGVMTRNEMLSRFFVHDGGDTSKWRLKGHAEDEFWQWISSWAVMIRKPSDLGYSDEGFELPELRYHEHIVEAELRAGELFPTEALSMLERRRARQSTVAERVALCADLVNQSSEPWVVWCDLNPESEALTKAIQDAVEVRGAHKREYKESAMWGFVDGTHRVIVSKPSICGFGMNWQHCANVAFVGLSDSWEAFYQAVRRCWRYGQTKPVNCHLIISEREGAVLKNIKRKEADAQKMQESIAKYMNEKSAEKKPMPIEIQTEKIHQTDKCTLHLGDAVEVSRGIETATAGFSIFSPPFASLYTYSDSERDMGNCADYDEFFTHFDFLVPEIYRILKPGRLVAIHCFDIPSMKGRDGYIGLKDFPADLRKSFESHGFIYHSKVTIWKDPVTQMQRTKALGLLHKQIRKDSSMCRQGLPDYLLVMRKPDVNQEPIYHYRDAEELIKANKGQVITDEMESRIFPVGMWQEYASPVWMDINPSKTLNRDGAREERDERHICPLQIEVVERALQLWSNPGDVVFTPFLGIGTEVYCALKAARKGLGVELKQSYFEQAVGNCNHAEEELKQQVLFQDAA